MTKMISATAIAAAALLFAGCDSGASVSGTITLDGQPPKGGVVTFHPVNGGPAAIGAVGSDGQYTLMVGQDRSVPPGDYTVTIESTESEPYQTQPANNAKAPPPPKRVTPDKYASVETTDLKATVKAGSQKIELKMTSGK